MFYYYLYLRKPPWQYFTIQFPIPSLSEIPILCRYKIQANKLLENLNRVSRQNTTYDRECRIVWPYGAMKMFAGIRLFVKIVEMT